MDDFFDLIVIGAGSGGLAAAKRAASYGARVAVIEGDRVGGTCVIRGCVPKKLLVYGSSYVEQLRHASAFGIEIKNFNANSKFLLSKVRKEVDRLNLFHENSLQKAGIEVFFGWGKLTSNNSILVSFPNENKAPREIKGNKILIAVGGKALIPDLPGSNLGWISDDIFLLNDFPDKIVIVGGGFIACEFACIFNALGIDVTLLIRGNSLLTKFDGEISNLFTKTIKNNGIDCFFGQKPKSIEGFVGNLKITTDLEKDFFCGGVLFAAGRTPFIENLNLDSIGVITENGKIAVDDNNSTSIPNIFAIGDVTDRVNLTPVAIDEGRALADRLFGNKERKVSYENIPSAVFSQPEIASVGLTEKNARDIYGEENIIIYRSSFRPMSQTLTQKQSLTMLKLIVLAKTDKIIGCHMIGDNSAEIIQMASIAINMGATKLDFDSTMALHATAAEEFVTMK